MPWVPHIVIPKVFSFQLVPDKVLDDDESLHSFPIFQSNQSCLQLYLDTKASFFKCTHHILWGSGWFFFRKTSSFSEFLFESVATTCVLFWIARPLYYHYCKKSSIPIIMLSVSEMLCKCRKWDTIAVRHPNKLFFCYYSKATRLQFVLLIIDGCFLALKAPASLRPKAAKAEQVDDESSIYFLLIYLQGTCRSSQL